MKRFFLLLMLLSVFLVGCSEDHPSYTKHLPSKTTELDDRISMDAVVSAENLSYSRMLLEIPETYAEEPLDSRLFSFTKDGFYVPMQYTNNTQGFLLAATILKYDKQGVLTDEIPVPAETYHAKGISVLSDGRFVIYRDMSERGHTHQKSFLQIFDAEGLLLAECNVPPFSEAVENDLGQLDYQSLLVDEAADGTIRIMINAVDRVFLYDEALTLLTEYSIPGECRRIFRESDGVYILGNTMPSLFRLDCHTETVTQIKTLPIPPEFYYSAQFYWDFSGKMYCVHDGAVYLCEETDDASSMKKILTWTGGALSGKGLFWMFHDGAIVYLDDSSVFFQQALYYLEIGGGRAVENRQVLKLAMLAGPHNDWYLEFISHFNETNEDYYIAVLDFTKYIKGQHTTEQFQNYLLNHEFPDMVLFSSIHEIRNYVEKGVLLDIQPYYGDALIGCASHAFDDADGHQYGLPIAMSLTTFASASSVQSDPLTWNDLYAFEDEILSGAGDTAIFSDTVNALDYYLTQDMYDMKSHTVSFDDGRFEERVAFLDRTNERYVKKGAGSVSMNTSMRYVLKNGNTLPAELQSGNVKLLQVPIRTLDIFSILKFLYGDTPYTFCGFPTEHGQKPGAQVSSSAFVCISSLTEHRDGCLQFADFLLSDMVQTSEVLTQLALPVTRSAIEQLLEERQYSIISPLAESRSSNSYDIHPQHSTADAVASLNPDGRNIGVKLTEKDREQILDFLETCDARTHEYVTIVNIRDEELSAYKSGARTLSDAAKLIQSRVWIYVNE